MAKFTLTFGREVITRETVQRTIEAPDRDAAIARATEMADEFDGSCPDDVDSRGTDCGDWRASFVQHAPDDAEIDD